MTARAHAAYSDPVRLAIVLCVLAAATHVRAEPDDPTSDAPCLRPPVRVAHFRRQREEVSLALTRCDGSPNLDALDPLSVVARAWRTPPPSPEEIAAYRQAHPDRRGWLTRRHRRLHPGLLTRLQALANRWPGRRFLIVSGHRPNANPGSRHRVGKALDLQIEGVEREEVARFARLLADTGVGYYPRSTFTHIDVRSRAAFWIDRSGPGERADYGSWPGWELDPPGAAEPAELDVAAVRREVADAVAAADGARADEREPDPGPGPDPGDQPEALLDLDEVRRRTREVVGAMPAARPTETRARPTETAARPTPATPGERPDAIVRRERLPTPPIDWSVPW